jgi:hypothetical protein
MQIFHISLKKHARTFNRKFFLELKKMGDDQPQQPLNFIKSNVKS